MPRHLDSTSEAYGKVGSALHTFSMILTGLQDDISPLTIRAPHLWDDLCAAQASVSIWAPDNTAALGLPPSGTAASDPPWLSEQATAAKASLTAAQAAWDSAVAQATAIKVRASEAARTCASLIREAKGTRFVEPATGFQGYVFSHSEGIIALRKLLNAASAAGTVICLIPVLGEFAAPIAAPFALVTGAGAGIASVSLWVGGAGSGTDALIDTTAGFLPGAKLVRGTAGAKGFWRVAESGVTADDATVFHNSAGLRATDSRFQGPSLTT